MIEERIISSLLDNDFYTLTVGQVAFKSFPTLNVQYQFINRNGTPFPDGFINELNHQLELMKGLRFTQPELDWLKFLGYFSDEYLKWLSEYQFNPSELTINQNNGILTIIINGSWVRTIMWEVPLLSLISELYYRILGLKPKNWWKDKILKKAQNLDDGSCLWIDFGTRRRFSFDVQNQVVSTMKYFKGFLGTSNIFLAFKHNIKPNGTMSHQGPMAMMAKYGIVNANRKWMKYWKETYGEKLLIYLVDTFTTDHFLSQFNQADALVWDGLRQDSGDPSEWMDKILKHYNGLDVPTTNKKFIFSDSLTDETYKELSLKYRNYATIVGGIGTALSNDCGHKPLNIVVKLISADGKDVVKLSDHKGKHTGKPEAIRLVKEQLRIGE